VVTILNTYRVDFNCTKQYWYKWEIIIARWLGTLIEMSRTLLEKNKRNL